MPCGIKEPAPATKRRTQTAFDQVLPFNAFARNDLDVPPAAVTPCTYNSLPTNIPELMDLIPDVHESFFDHAAGPDFTTLDFKTPYRRNVQDFDPTSDMYPLPSDSPAGTKAQSTAKAYFKARPIEVVQVTGTDNRQDLNIAFQIALDPDASLIFTFITALSD